MTKREAEQAVKLYADQCEMVEPAILENQICRDADDDKVLGTAIAGNCSCIITGDDDLLELKKYQNVNIFKPVEFWTFEIKRDLSE